MLHCRREIRQSASSKGLRTAAGSFRGLAPRTAARRVVSTISTKSSRDSRGSASYDPNAREIPVRVLIDREAADTRIFVARLVRDHQESGRRAELARLLDRRNDVPWYLVRPEVRG